MSLSRRGGWIDTNGFDAAIAGDVLHDGSLTKRGAGTLTLAGRCLHTGDTIVVGGTLLVDGMHPGPLLVEGGTLGGSGSVGQVSAIAGRIHPGGRGGAVANDRRTVPGGLCPDVLCPDAGGAGARQAKARQRRRRGS